MATFNNFCSNEAPIGPNHKRQDDKIFSDKNKCWIWVWNQFLRRAEPSEQSCDEHQGDVMSSVNNQVWRWTLRFFFFLSVPPLSIIKRVHLVFLEAGSIGNQPVCFAVTTVSFQSLRLVRSLNFIYALAPWQPTASRELYSKDKCPPLL